MGDRTVYLNDEVVGSIEAVTDKAAISYFVELLRSTATSKLGPPTRDAESGELTQIGTFRSGDVVRQVDFREPIREYAKAVEKIAQSGLDFSAPHSLELWDADTNGWTEIRERFLEEEQQADRTHYVNQLALSRSARLCARYLQSQADNPDCELGDIEPIAETLVDLDCVFMDGVPRETTELHNLRYETSRGNAWRSLSVDEIGRDEIDTAVLHSLLDCEPDEAIRVEVMSPGFGENGRSVSIEVDAKSGLGGIALEAQHLMKMPWPMRAFSGSVMKIDPAECWFHPAEEWEDVRERLKTKYGGALQPDQRADYERDEAAVEALYAEGKAVLNSIEELAYDTPPHRGVAVRKATEILESELGCGHWQEQLHPLKVEVESCSRPTYADKLTFSRDRERTKDTVDL